MYQLVVNSEKQANNNVVFLDRLYNFIIVNDTFDLCVAYSGGLDSHVLLHVLSVLRARDSKINLRAVHVNHGISLSADDWANHCSTLCRQLNIELLVKKINPPKKANEAVLRDMRYQIFAECMQENECLVTAHTKDDQAETLLLQLLRGAGPQGLSAMPESSSFSSGKLLRPFINFSRDELMKYAKENQLEWIEDESNNDLRYDRNFIRHRVFPVLQERWPSLTTTFARSSKHCAEANELLQGQAERDFGTVKAGEGTGNILRVDKLLKLSASRQRNIIRYWLQYLNLQLPNVKKLEQIQNEVLHSRWDATPKVIWPGAEVRRYRDKLYAMSALKPHDNNLVIQWSGKNELLLPEGLGIVMPIEELPKMQLAIRFRQGGERCRIKGRNGSHALKKLFQEWGVPPWQRDRIPLVYAGDTLVAVVGYCVCKVKGEL